MCQTQPILSSAPESPDLSATYVFYLHGQIIETAGRRPTHPQFGVYEYDEILGALSGPGRVVVSEQRAPDTDVAEYADSIAAQVRALIAQGVPAEHIAVVGFSKGGRIAIATSAALRERVTYVFLAACSQGVFDTESYRVSGRVLSIYEETDEIGVSCGPLLERSASMIESREVRISTGARHGAFYQPRAEWVREVLRWVPSPGG
jgi:pimeloyl-ACP methyl ester carboxylesterase